ncbi:MAG TPA: tripartite tricarboxylate transporter substrate binding protein [Burkholderiales bacterium]|nr:tripartite tricarboxylate transporter substrate binding protein [Burkholderiales bacterium]
MARLIVAFLALAIGATQVLAQQYPAKPVRLILPFPPGGSTDLLGRALAEKLGENLGQSVVPENRPGAGGNIGAEAAARSAPDGYTLVLCAPSLAISPSLYSKLNYDPQRDLVPVALVANIPNLFVLHPAVPARSLAELVQYARDNPGKLNFGTGGPGTSNQLAADMFRSLTKTNVVLVPYKGAETALLALLAGQVQMVVIGPPAAAPHVRSGKLRALAVLAKERYPGMPDVPTAAESGMPEFEVDTWYGVLAPAGTPREIVARLNAELTRLMQSKEMRDRLATMGIEPMASTSAEFGEFLAAEIAKWAKVVKESGAKVE